MKNIIWIVALIIIGGIIVSNLLEESVENNPRDTAREEAEQKISAEIDKMISRHNAISGWEKELVDSTGYRLGSVYTIELEDLWLVDSPILFYGTIEDISTINNEEAKIEFEVDTYRLSDAFLDTELHLNLVMSLEAARQFLESYPELNEGFFNNRYVAIVASINSISKKTSLSTEGEYGDRYIEEIDIKIGNGRLLEILYIGDSLGY